MPYVTNFIKTMNKDFTNDYSRILLADIIGRTTVIFPIDSVKSTAIKERVSHNNGIVYKDWSPYLYSRSCDVYDNRCLYINNRLVYYITHNTKSLYNHIIHYIVHNIKYNSNVIVIDIKRILDHYTKNKKDDINNNFVDEHITIELINEIEFNNDFNACIQDLINDRIITKTIYKNVYTVNTNYIFKGNRNEFNNIIQQYYLKHFSKDKYFIIADKYNRSLRYKLYNNVLVNDNIINHAIRKYYESINVIKVNAVDTDNSSVSLDNPPRRGTTQI